MSTSWLLDADPPPKILVLPPDADDLGEADAAIELWEHYARKRLDPTQRLAVQVMMAQSADGRWAAATTGREMPRQNGKGDEIEVVELWGLVQRAEAILHTVHDAVLLASQTQQRMLGVLEGHADLRRLVKRKWQGTGQQMIELRNGGVVWYRTRTGGGGRGVDDIDRLVVDEAQHATEEQLAAVSPTLMANPNPQLNAMGTAGLAGHSAWWWTVRRRALSDDPGRFGYVGHTAEDVALVDGEVEQAPFDPADRSLWGPTNPAVATGRGSGMEFLEEQFRTLGPESFAREHLGRWDPPAQAAGTSWDLFAEDRWVAAASPLCDGWMADPVTLAIETTPDRAWTSIGAAGAHPDGRVALEVVEHRAGTDWVAARMAELVEHRPKAVLLDPRSPAGGLVRDLVEAGVEITELNSSDYARACGSLFDAVMSSTPSVAHHGQEPLDMAAESATRRPLGDAWVFDRRQTVATPLAVVALARWGHLEIAEPAPVPDFVVL